MTNNKLGLIAVAAPTQIISVDDRMNATAFDGSIRAQLLNVAIGFSENGTKAVQLFVDLSVYLSIEAQGHSDLMSTLLMIPAKVKRGPELYDHHTLTIARWKSVCTAAFAYTPRRGMLQSSVGNACTLRLLFDAYGTSEANDIADGLCARFADWHEAATGLREAMESIRSTLVAAQSGSRIYMPLRYHSAAICKGWQERIVNPTYAQPCFAMDELESPGQLGNLFVARCEAIWSEMAETINAPEAIEDEATKESDDLANSTDAADDFVCADQMLTLWYGSKRRRHQRS
ncbi:hypothetical protein [Mesorhizobium sp. M0138]|uniref:hypothetical protein n=1 Tax=Mesorhizobium sp. M0138 TaxID=2956891 RepID=UPI0033362A79